MALFEMGYHTSGYIFRNAPVSRNAPGSSTRGGYLSNAHGEILG